MCAQHIGVDFDDETEASTIEQQLKSRFVQRYASLIYTTQSHTEEKPRCRIIFLTDEPEYNADSHRARTRTVCSLLGADVSATEPTRAFYGSGENGRAVVLGNVLPLSVVDSVVSEYQEATVRPAKTYESETLDEAKAVELLRKINLDSFQSGVRHEALWRTCAVVKKEFPSNGLDMLLAWQPERETEIREQWRSSRVSKLGIGTLYYYGR